MKSKIIFVIAGCRQEFVEHESFLENYFPRKIVWYCDNPDMIRGYMQIGDIDWELARIGTWHMHPKVDEFGMLEIEEQKRQGKFV